jgi:glycosyltransferase involved in cell wall biosynthesis
MKVAMMTEGTYPYSFGGVSVWCDQLIRGMHDYEFCLLALVATGTEPVVWDLPGNITSLINVPLWGPPPARRRAGRQGELPSRLLRAFFNSVIDPDSDVQASGFGQAIHELYEFAQDTNLTAALGSEKAVRLLVETWQEHRERQAMREQQPIALPTPTMHDAVTAVQLLEHSLRPLSQRPVEVDVIHVATNGLGVLPAITAKWRHKTPVIVSEHGIYLREQYLNGRRLPYRWPVKSLYLGFMRQLCSLGYREAETITPCNIYNRRWEERLGADPSRIRTVYNGVDPANFPVFDDEPAEPAIAWAGRVDPIKDLETLLRAFALVHREMPEAKLRMFGAPPKGREAYLEKCRGLAAELGVAEAATFEGHLTKVREAYGAGRVVALSSVSEGFPYSLIEAMTCGRTCVATDVGGVTEAVGNTGIVVPPPAAPRPWQEPSSACCGTTTCGTGLPPRRAPAHLSSSQLTALSASSTKSTASSPLVIRCQSPTPRFRGYQHDGKYPAARAAAGYASADLGSRNRTGRGQYRRTVRAIRRGLRVRRRPDGDLQRSGVRRPE